MHIPDGYLSPSTCATLYAASAPFWYVSLKRVKKQLSSRLVPLLSVFAALSFVIMMFNVPLPGGTTGHAVGMGIATIVLGPWASILALSAAIFIQALFFGDGGITTFGANCFNMAIVGSLAAFVIYRIVAGHCALTARRRVLAGAMAGYLAINTSALCAAVELGIQPLLFRTAAGAPLYAPYPLHIAVPAMLIGHLTFAGVAELVLTGGLVAYLQKSNPQLLRRTAPGSLLGGEREPTAEPAGWKAARPLGLLVALLLVLTPLGILAGGKAWGEWTARDFSNPTMRQQIAKASSDAPPPTHAPGGLARLSTFWTAPFARYAPPGVGSRAFGYVLSGMFGAGVIILLSLIVAWLAERFRRWRTDGRPA